MPTTEYADADRRLMTILTALPGAAWSAPSGCEGWTAADVVDHLITTQRDFLAERGLDAGPPVDGRDDPVAAWRGHADATTTLLADPAVASLAFDGFFGPTTVGETIDRFYVWDMLVHRWDIAQAAGLDAGFSPAELERIDAGADSFGEALYMEGICRPAVEIPEGADRATQVLGRLGRAAATTAGTQG